ncbi:MAG: hypothetical protein JWP52_1828, partial [Rhizobacter sp.]|nr:hypothetical protein [Rhizobacter sp.]
EALACSNEDMRWIGTPMNLRAMVQPFEALLLALSGEASAALGMVHTLQRDFASGNPDDPRYFLHLHLRFWELRVADLVDDRGEVLRIASELPPWTPGPAALIVDQRATLPARVALAEGRLADACEGFEQAIALGMRIDCFGQLDEVRMRLAHTRLQLGQVDAAAAALAPTLAHATQPGAEPAGHWVLAGARILGDLARFAWQSRLRPAEVALIARWADEAASLRGIAGRPAQAMAAPRAASHGPAAAGAVTLPFNRAGQRPVMRGEPASGHSISEREREVLERMAAGDSNKLIARALDLSPHTVKRHVANILDKLELSTRGQAAAWFLHQHH